MALAIGDEERALAEVVRSLLHDRGARSASRAVLDAPDAALPEHWREFAALGFLGVHLRERDGGGGGGLAELAVVLFEHGRAAAPGPCLPTVLASAVLDAADPPASDVLRRRVLAGLARGVLTGAVGLGGRLRRDPRGALTGDAGHVLGAGSADVLLLVLGDDVEVLDARGAGVEVGAGRGVLDGACPPLPVRLHGAVPVGRLPGAAGPARRLARLLAAAAAAGAGRACLDLTVAHVGAREQFGRPVGSFQAVQHRCVDVLVDTELAAASVWDAARAPAGPGADLAAAVAAARAFPAMVRAAESCIQLHGAVGFTWEHDAHLYLRRVQTLAAFADSAGDAARDVAELAAAQEQHRNGPGLPDLPEHAAGHRTAVREFARSLSGRSAAKQRIALVDSGYLVPHWPAPWGRGADAVEQLVVEQELGAVDVPGLGISGWVGETVAQHGTDEQRDRWVRPTLLGELTWCQLFSEPGAGSDAAAVATRAVRTDGGWRVTGQKVWTTGARDADLGLATVRTDSSGTPHTGVTMVVVDLRAPGVTVRPLREMTGDRGFSEVFLDDVLVPDADVVGEVGQGWRVARATLRNERVSIGERGAVTAALTARDLVETAVGAGDLPRWAPALGALLAEDRARRALLVRSAARAVEGADPGPGGALAKLVAGEHSQRVARLGMQLGGMAAAAGDDPALARAYLWAPCLTIAGGTSEIVRDQVAQRVLGLPRPPRPRC